jgi:hypothetical protein
LPVWSVKVTPGKPLDIASSRFGAFSVSKSGADSVWTFDGTLSRSSWDRAGRGQRERGWVEPPVRSAQRHVAQQSASVRWNGERDEVSARKSVWWR